MLLHTVSTSPYSSPRVHDAARYSAAGDAVLLLADAVYAAVGAGEFAATIAARPDISWYAIAEDCQIRGIDTDQLQRQVRCIDYAKFVELTIAADSTVTW